MANSKLEVSALDFDDIKQNLRSFLSQQSQFSDYNFEGSGMAVLLDILAYNTHYLSFNANMLANEMYIDSADTRKNLVSLAKMLNYSPKSGRAAKATVDILLNTATGASVTLSRGTSFSSTMSGNSYKFVTNEDVTISPENGVYKFSNVEIFEGTLSSFNYTYLSEDTDFRFVLPNADMDTSTLTVQVQESVADTTTNTYTLANNYENINSESTVFFLQETETGEFEIYFGDGIFGKALSNGNIVKTKYIVTNRALANGANTFILTAGSIGGFSNVTITTVTSAQGGADEESKSSIRFNAPLSYASQNRAVTTSDYEVKVLELYPNAKSISAWGGEDDENPIYGTVNVAIQPKSGSTLTETTKESIKTSLKTFNVASVQPKIVDADTTDILLTVTAKYDANKTALGSETLKTDILNVISNYNQNNLSVFDGVFRFSKVSTLIDSSNSAIVSNTTTIRLRKSFTPTLNTSTTYNVYYRNAIYNPHSGHNSSSGGIIQTTGFKISGNSDTVYFLDDDGAGNLRRYSLVGGVRTYANNTQGTIDYNSGALTISSLNVSSVENIRGSVSTVIEITTTPESNDVVPVRGQVLEIDTSNSTVFVEADTFVGGSSDAGVGYTTTSSYTSTSSNY